MTLYLGNNNYTSDRHYNFVKKSHRLVNLKSHYNRTFTTAFEAHTILIIIILRQITSTATSVTFFTISQHVFF